MAGQKSTAVNDGEPERKQDEYHNKNNDDHDKKDKRSDPDLFCCLLQPVTSGGYPDYIGIRRLLLHRKAESGVLRRSDWRCNGKTYGITYEDQGTGKVHLCKSIEYSGKQDNLLVDASVGDGLRL